MLPLDVLEKTLHRQLLLSLKDGRTLKGKLLGYDQYMNLVLEDVEERSNDQVRKLGMVILRGNTIVSIAPS